MIPEALKHLIHELTKLPSVGPKSAERIALYLITEGEEASGDLGKSLSAASENVGFCPECGALSRKDESCSVCSDPARDRSRVCVVEGPLDVLAFEKGASFDGVYFVLGGVLSPLEGVTPEDLKIPELMKRIGEYGTKEVIVATNPTAEGDVTAIYLAGELKPLGVNVSRLARGIPTGAQVDYADSETLDAALKNRVEL